MSQKLARPRRKSDRVGHQDRELPRLHPDDVAHRQWRADPHVPEEHLQNTDDLVVQDDSPRRVFTCLPLDGSICLSPRETEFIEQFARQCPLQASTRVFPDGQSSRGGRFTGSLSSFRS